MIEFSALPFGTALLATLVVIAFLSGIGISAIGPGGIFLTIALYGLTSLSASTIAGTAQLMFIATGALASVAYLRSGDLSGETVTWTALLCLGSVLGAFFGALINRHVSRGLFGLLLGFLAGATGVIIVYREWRDLSPMLSLDHESTRGKVGYGVLGFVLGTFSGLLGVGGPVIAVPALVLLGVPMLPAVAAAQVQSIFIATFSFVGYLLQDAVSFVLAVAMGVPLLFGVVLGWAIAQRTNPERLKVVLGLVLLVVAPYLVV